MRRLILSKSSFQNSSRRCGCSPSSSSLFVLRSYPQHQQQQMPKGKCILSSSSSIFTATSREINNMEKNYLLLQSMHQRCCYNGRDDIYCFSKKSKSSLPIQEQIGDDDEDDRGQQSQRHSRQSQQQSMFQCVEIPEEEQAHDHEQPSSSLVAPCGTIYSQYDPTPLPDPLPEPKYTYKRRVLVTRIPRVDNELGNQVPMNPSLKNPRIKNPIADRSNSHSSSSGSNNNNDNNNNNNTPIMSYTDHDNNDNSHNDYYAIVPYNSLLGKQYLIDSLVENTSSSYMSLMEHYCNQDDPAYCGITTLMMICNSLYIDPKIIRWKYSGWRYYGNEDMMLTLHPCINPIRIQRNGINMEQFYRLSQCQNLYTIMKRPISINSSNTTTNRSNSSSSSSSSSTSEAFDPNKRFECSVDEFRNDIIRVLTSSSSVSSSSDEDPHIDDYQQYDNDCRIVVSFSRGVLQQTGDGHYSPIAAYHQKSDTCLVLDVARFKYQPYWVPIPLLYKAMIPSDSHTKQSRGWFLLQKRNRSPSHRSHDQPLPRSTSSMSIHPNYNYNKNNSEDCIPAQFVLPTHQNNSNNNPCPIHPLKVQYCNNNKNNHDQEDKS